MARKLTIATSQFNVSSNININLKNILKQMKVAKSKKADIVQFPECCLVGYGGIDFLDYKSYDEKILKRALKQITDSARELNIWVIVGSHHFIKNQEKPFNSLYIINNKGLIVDRYDKRYLTGLEGEMDQKYYSSGIKPVLFNLKDITCGVLICHEWRYVELYREYCALGAQIVFQSFYDGNLSPGEYIEEGMEQGQVIPGTMRGNAANNYLWISSSNISNRESTFPSFVLRPDGGMYNKLKRNIPGLLISVIDFEKEFADLSRHWRGKILKERYNVKRSLK